MSGTRKLEAILVSDVAGYSRPGGADEERMLARLRALRRMTAMARTPVLSGRRPVVKGRFEDAVNVSGAVMSSAF